MKKTIQILAITFISFTLMSLIVRHDVADKDYIELGKKYPQVVHFSDGEGTLIEKDWIITAAHVADYLKKMIANGKEQQILTMSGKSYDIETIVVHPDYAFTNTSIVNDIALVKLKKSIENIKPVLLYNKTNEEGKFITIVGRGDQGTGLTGPKVMDKITRAATNKIDAATNQWISFDFDSPSSKDVTKYEGVSGPGDSGGPALIENKGILSIAGVSSHQNGTPTYGEGRYGVIENYARVSSYVKWIKRTIQKN